MLRFGDEFLNENIPNPKGFFGFIAGAQIFIFQVFFPVDHPHPASATAGSGLQNHRIATNIGVFSRFFQVKRRFFYSGNGRHIDRFGDNFRLNFIPQGVQHLMGRPDEDNAGTLAVFGKLSIFRQKPVTRVDGVSPLGLGQGNNFSNVQIRINRQLPFTDLIRFISHCTI